VTFIDTTKLVFTLLSSDISTGARVHLRPWGLYRIERAAHDDLKRDHVLKGLAALQNKGVRPHISHYGLETYGQFEATMIGRLAVFFRKAGFSFAYLTAAAGICGVLVSPLVVFPKKLGVVIP